MYELLEDPSLLKLHSKFPIVTSHHHVTFYLHFISQLYHHPIWSYECESNVHNPAIMISMIILYLRAWAKLSSFVRLVDAKKALSQHFYKPTVNPITLLQQFSQDFKVLFALTSILTGVLKNIHKNGLLSKYQKASYTITKFYNLNK